MSAELHGMLPYPTAWAHDNDCPEESAGLGNSLHVMEVKILLLPGIKPQLLSSPVYSVVTKLTGLLLIILRLQYTMKIN
jgi:hypothetical protein